MEEKNVIHISQFYPCTKVNVSVELAYIVEVSKYLHDKGMVLSLDGILFEEDLIESRFWDYFRMGVSEGWIIDVDCDMFIPIDIQFPIDYSVKLRNILIVEDEVMMQIMHTELLSVQESYSKVKRMMFGCGI